MVRLKDLFGSKVNLRGDALRDSALHSLIDYNVTYSILVYGEAQSGKSRLVAQEAAILAKALGDRVTFLVTEPNWTLDDVENVFAAAAKYGVPAEVLFFDSVPTLVRYVEKMILKHAEAGRVVVLDSISSIITLASQSRLDVDVLSPQAAYAQASLAFDRVVGGLRRYVSRVGGYLLTVAHATKTLGRMWRDSVAATPRFAQKAMHYLDAVVYMELTTRDAGYIDAVTVRRFKPSTPRLTFRLVSETVKAAGVVERSEDEKSGVKRFSFTPGGEKAAELELAGVFVKLVGRRR